MADDPRTSLQTPQPNKLLDSYRLQILAALEEAKRGTAGVDDNYFLVDLAFDLVDSVLADNLALRAALDALEARVVALEPPFAPTNPEEPAP